MRVGRDIRNARLVGTGRKASPRPNPLQRQCDLHQRITGRGTIRDALKPYDPRDPTLTHILLSHTKTLHLAAPKRKTLTARLSQLSLNYSLPSPTPSIPRKRPAGAIEFELKSSSTRNGLPETFPFSAISESIRRKWQIISSPESKNSSSEF